MVSDVTMVDLPAIASAFGFTIVAMAYFGLASGSSGQQFGAAYPACRAQIS